eukprot:TRINITY_DN39333_c0_g1_i2.p1 TRINITY_DN39333_c0_g1~~TRINITY_DN39333_c0_g1_i2.p1  ORF type:complete len:495 (-),score=84.57 TRINITY_DN39333_c0_g1_i2:189-1673(-)
MVVPPPSPQEHTRNWDKKSIECISSREFSRELSFAASGYVHQPVGVRYSKLAAMAFTMNLCLGMGPLTLPYAFAGTGFLLGGAVLVGSACLAYLTTTFVMEALVLGNEFLFVEAEEGLLRASKTKEAVEPHEAVLHQMEVRPDKVYKIRERIEFGELATRLLPAKVSCAIYAILFSYAFGTLCCFAVCLTTCASSFFPTMSRGAIVSVLGSLLFPACFVSLQKLQRLQQVVIIIRAFTIMSMVVVCCVLSLSRPDIFPESQHEVSAGWLWHGIPMANPSGFPNMFANGVLVFLLHHCIPGLVSPLEEKTDGPGAIAGGFFGVLVLYLLIGGTAVLAFGSRVPALYSLAFEDASVPGLRTLICAYPFCIIGSYPVTSITLRNNFVNAFGLQVPDGSCNFKDFLTTAAAGLPPFAVAYFTDDVQAVVNFVAGYFGITLLLIVPVVLVVRARSRHPPEVEKYPLKAVWGTQCVFYGIAAFWVFGVVFNTWRMFFMKA